MALSWPQKDPDEVLDYRWNVGLDAGDTVTSATAILVSGDVVIDSQSSDATGLTVWLSGGTSGVTNIFRLVALTAGGRSIEDMATIAVVSNTVTLPPPGYSDPTPYMIKLDFPAFAAVDDAVIQRTIDLRIPMWVDESWPESLYTYAGELVVAHYLSRAGLGKNSQAANAAASGISRIKSADFELTLADSATSADLSGFSSTTYGRDFLALLYRAKGGPTVVSGGGCGIAGAATDVPFVWKFGGFGL